MAVEGNGRATRYRHRESRYTVRAPSSPGTLGGVDIWRRVDVKRADITFRGPKRDFVSVISDCDAETARRPNRLASGLLVGVENRRKVDAGVLEASSGEGWYQVYEARFDGQPVRIKTVTMVSGECVFDWVLVSPGNFGLAERSFEAWRATFEPPAEIGERP
jgi:hypothetical protein